MRANYSFSAQADGTLVVANTGGVAPLDGTDLLRNIETAAVRRRHLGIIVGTPNNDTSSHGTAQDDLMLGLAGNDVLNGGAGNDILVGGPTAHVDDHVRDTMLTTSTRLRQLQRHRQLGAGWVETNDGGRQRPRPDPHRRRQQQSLSASTAGPG